MYVTAVSMYVSMYVLGIGTHATYMFMAWVGMDKRRVACATALLMRPAVCVVFLASALVPHAFFRHGCCCYCCMVQAAGMSTP